MTTRPTTLLVLLACFSVPAVAAAQTSGKHALGFPKLVDPRWQRTANGGPALVLKLAAVVPGAAAWNR